MIVVTGATGKLGRHVIAGLLKKVPAAGIVAAVRDTAKAADLAALGVHVRHADYGDAASLDSAFKDAKSLLLISSSAIGQRVPQHAAVIAAAKRANVEQLAYTSILHADTSGMALASEHQATEAAIRAAGIPCVFLRNGWYLENYTENLQPALAHGVILGSAGDGRIAAAARADYAAAAVAVLTGSGHAGKVYELAGDKAFTMTDLAAEVARLSGKKVVYQNLPAAEYEAALTGFGMPAPVARFLADADLGVSRGCLDDSGGQLSKLMGRATTPLAVVLDNAIRNQ